MEQCRILIVDDDPKLSRLVKAMLDSTGVYKTAVENRPHQALETARVFKPNLVLLDVDMPGKDGGQIAWEMRVDRSLQGAAIIFLTSLVSGNQAGMRETAGKRTLFLSKPTDRMTLCHAIENTLATALH
jgi:CheY-like chemotaxis protein